MIKEDKLYQLMVQLDQLDEIRADLVALKNAHIDAIEKFESSSMKALKDWQQNLSRILQAMDSCNAEIRKILHQ